MLAASLQCTGTVPVPQVSIQRPLRYQTTIFGVAFRLYGSQTAHTTGAELHGANACPGCTATTRQ